jgi:ribosomal 50S subunit-recycling heat shock protein
MSKFKQLKYKKLLRLRQPLHNNTRVLNFKRPKWILFKKFFTNKFLRKIPANSLRPTKYKIRFPFFNQEGNYAPARWVHLRFRFRDNLAAKNRVIYFFTLQESLHKLKKISIKKQQTVLSLIESRLDVILWRAGFFSTPAIARFFILHKHIFVNNLICNKPNFTLKQGDVVTCNVNAKKHITGSFKKSLISHPVTSNLSLQKKRNMFLASPFLVVNWNLLSFIWLQSNLTQNVNIPYLYNINLNSRGFSDYLRNL